MPSTTFVLKEPTGQEATLVYLIFRFNGSKLKYSTVKKLSRNFGIPKNKGQRKHSPIKNLSILRLKDCQLCCKN